MSCPHNRGGLAPTKARQLARVEKKLQARRITVLGDGYFEVPSGRGGSHLVSFVNNRWFCSDCVHFNAGTGFCDHILIIQRFMEEGQPLELQAEPRLHRVQTQRNWPLYKAYRRVAPVVIELMLRDICLEHLDAVRLLPKHRGRPPLSVRDAIICGNARRMTRGSGLDADALVKSYYQRGWLMHPEPPHEDSIAKALRRDDVHDQYTRLIAIAAREAAHLESTFAIDAQKWRTPCSLYEVYVKDAETKKKRWRKANFMYLQAAIAHRTKLVGAVAILTEEDGEAPQTIALTQRLREFFVPKLLVCDTAYSEGVARQWLRDHHIITRIPFKSNAQPAGDGSAWDLDLAEFLDADDHYWAEYFARLTVESYFGALERNNGNVKKLRSKQMESQAAELLSMVLNYQMRMLLNAIVHLGVSVPWLADDTLNLIGDLKGSAGAAQSHASAEIVEPESKLLIFPSRRAASKGTARN